MNLIEFATRNTRLMLASLAFLIVAGYVGFRLMPLEAEPDIPIPIIYVRMTLPGIAPTDAERLLAKPMEKELQTIAGLDEITSTSYLGGASVVLKFDAGFDSTKAINDVREKVDLARPEIPQDAEEPTIHEVNTSLFPVLIVTLSGNIPEETLIRLSRDLKDRIEGLSEIIEVNIKGEREDVLIAEIDPLRLESYGLNADAITALVNQQNRLIPAGILDDGKARFALKVPGLFENIEDIQKLPIKVNGDAIITLGDVATIKPTFKDPLSVARIDGLPAIGLEISKRSGENIISTIDHVKEIVENQRQSWPSQIKVTYSQDRSQDIREMMLDLTNNLISAIVLVMIVIIGSLGVRSGIIVGLSVPGSFLIGIFALYLAGITINIVVLFSLIMATGMLVDGAIVVVEYADRKMLEGASRLEAYTEGAKRMAWPVFSSIATIIAAFLPMLFWPGIVGEFMRYLPITLTSVLTASLVMALLFIPCIGALMGKPGTGAAALLHNEQLPMQEQLARTGGLEKYYLKALYPCLNHPYLTLLSGILVLIAVYVLYGTLGPGVQFFPEVEPRAAVIKIHARGNISMDERSRLTGQVEKIILALNAEKKEMRSVYAVANAGEAVQLGTRAAEDVIGNINIEFGHWQSRRPAKAILADIAARTASLPGIKVQAEIERNGPDQGKPIAVRISSSNDTKLIETTHLVRAQMEKMLGLTAIEDTLPVPGIEWQINIDRGEAAKYGIDVNGIGNVVRLVTEGLKFSTYRPDNNDDEVDIVARFPAQNRQLNEIDRLRVSTAQGAIPIANFINKEAVFKQGLVNRADGERYYEVLADVEAGILPDNKIREIQQWLTSTKVDPSVSISFQGQDKEQKESGAFLVRAFMVALALIAAILLAHFNGFFHVFLIMSACIMSTVGVMAGLLITGQPFGIVMSGIGVISLAGIVVSNNIILIDTYLENRKLLGDPYQALLLSGVQRFRPVFLTTATTVLGLLPLVLKLNLDFLSREITYGAPSTQWWTQLASAVVFGLIFAKALTLLLTPSILLIAAKFGAFWARKGIARRPNTTNNRYPAKSAE